MHIAHIVSGIVFLDYMWNIFLLKVIFVYICVSRIFWLTLGKCISDTYIYKALYNLYNCYNDFKGWFEIHFKILYL